MSGAMPPRCASTTRDHASRRVAFLLSSRSIAADHHVYALTDYREVDRSIALARTAAA